jgi:biopolymer transport protein ExbD
MATPRSKLPNGDGIFEPNMTPLIDVSLVLVVILMVATPLAFQSGINVNAATTTGKSSKEHAQLERIELSVQADGRVKVNRDVVERSALGATLQPLIAKSATGLVVVRCDDGVPHGDFVSVIDEARRSGAAKIAVLGS